MRTSYLLMLAALCLGLAVSASAQLAQPDSSLFSPDLWAYFQRLNPGPAFGNCLNCGDSANALRYWAGVSPGYDIYDAFMWNFYQAKLTGEDCLECPQGYYGAVRRVSAGMGHQPGVMLSGLNPGLWPYSVPFWSGDYRLQLFARITAPGPDTVVLTVKATWHDSTGAEHAATWGGADRGAFTASDLGTGKWTLTGPKFFHVENPDGSNWFGCEDLEITWTGARDLEIGYLTISSASDSKLVVTPSPPLP